MDAIMDENGSHLQSHLREAGTASFFQAGAAHVSHKYQ
jgi:hypothetical protein